jgi:DNA-binding NarL/FixJ family response regulator
VAALVCLGYTNKVIAKKLVVATSTVKTHIRHILRKFGLNGKLELKGVLREWDFSAWENMESE